MLPTQSAGGSDGTRKLIPVTIDGAKIFVEAQGENGVQTISGLKDVPQEFNKVADGIGKLSTTMLSALKAAVPSSLELEFGIDLKIEPDGLFAILVSGELAASLKVTVKWEHPDAKP